MKTNRMLPDYSLNKIWDRFNKMNGTIISFLPANWVEQEDGTFVNTITHPGFTADMVLEVDLYDDGNLTDTQITEYDSYITEFNIEDGKLVAVATTAPTQTIKILARGEFAIKSVEDTNLINKLTNENNETFNFGIKDGVRGFFTDPSRADDSFVPFKMSRKTQELSIDISTPSTVNLEFDNLSNVVGFSYYQKNLAEFSRVSDFSINNNIIDLTYLNNINTYTGTLKCKGVESGESLTTITKTVVLYCGGYDFGMDKVTVDELTEVVAITGFSCSGEGSMHGDVGCICCLGGNEIFVMYDNSGYSNNHNETITITVVGIV